MMWVALSLIAYYLVWERNVAKNEAILYWKSRCSHPMCFFLKLLALRSKNIEVFVNWGIWKTIERNFQKSDWIKINIYIHPVKHFKHLTWFFIVYKLRKSCKNSHKIIRFLDSWSVHNFIPFQNLKEFIALQSLQFHMKAAKSSTKLT